MKESIAHFGLNAEKADWLLYFFLPVVYWQIQLQRTSSEPLRYAYETAYEESLSLLNSHPLTPGISEEERARWHSRAYRIAMKFRRTSSAVEGRNGTLSSIVQQLTSSYTLFKPVSPL
ncbi:DUF6399 domain-containing protein [Desulfococcaceae bacterium HSG8]|nr:DUF6399 domain-containing protein [Desulfococcaceae bacterium HSG8]